MGLRDSAISKTMLSKLMEGRTKISTRDLIFNYQNGFTICAVDEMTNNKGDTFVVYNIKEDDSIFAFGGSAINNIFLDYIADNGIEFVNRELKDTGGLKIKLSSIRTREGREYTKVEVI